MDVSRILLVEDEPVTRMLLEARLRAAGHRVRSVASAEQALALLRAEEFALVVTDLLLQHLDGVSLMREARALAPDLELIVLTGAASVDSAIAAVDHGARAYLRKPAPLGELEDRVAAALDQRRARIERRTALIQLSAQLQRIAEPQGPRYDLGTEASRLCIGRLELDPQQRRVVVDRTAVTLSSGEFDLLLYLARRDNQVISAEQIAREGLGWAGCSPDEARELVKVRIHRLRRKIERDPHAPGLLVSVRGVGYMLTAGE